MSPQSSARPLRKAAARRWLSIREAAEYTGFSTRGIRQHIANGNLPAYLPRGSRVLRIDMRDLEDWLTGEGRVPSAHLGNGKAAGAGR
jgi:excisionase family DNA binding protein